MTTATPEEARAQIVNLVREFVRRDVEPVAAMLDKEDIVPHDLIDKMKEMGLFGITVPEEYGGMGLDYTTFATIFEEISKGFMSLTGPIGTHHILTYVLTHYGSEEQKQRFLPDLAAGRKRGALALTEPSGGSDVAALETTADKDGEEYVINGTKMFISNGRYADAYCLLARTDRTADPQHRGLSCFVVEKGGPGFTVGRDLDKLGYRGVDTSELHFEDYRIPAENLIGGEEGRGFGHVMSGLETGRINIAARAVGVAQAAFNAAIKYSQQRHTFGVPIAQHQAIQLKLADMATKIQAARLLTYDAAAKKDRGERVDLESGMAKLFASETCQEVTLEAMRVHGGYGYLKESPVERYYRDAPLMIIGEGTNEVMRLLIARQLLRRPEYQI
ncbi:MAG: acyl-CoA dehydrogenase [SAR202 cluster bacterium Io17-Chloro-G9]|nr:MAG: acyl-CoA dehydrogenase [SAR202 cluster bacterium Io17-Chloro-G9]